MLLRHCAVLALCAGPALAVQDTQGPLGDEPAQGPAGTGSYGVRIGIFDQADDNAGNPFLDEELRVIEPIILYDYNFTDRFGASFQFSYDNVSSASIDRLSKFDGQSGASGDFYFGLDSSFRYQLSERTKLGWSVHGSKEYDYLSLGLGGSFERQSVDRASSFGGSLTTYFDDVDIIRFDGSEEGSDSRVSVSGTLQWSTLLSPTTSGEVGLTIAHQSGFLETPYNAVVVEDSGLPPNPNLDNMAQGFEITEELPDSRLRTALYGKVRRRLAPGHALQLGGRIYSDDWGITAFNIEPQYHWQLSPRLTWMTRLRYYTQTEADAYSPNFTTEENERTQDSDLGAFDSILIGTHFKWITGGSSSIDFGVDYLDREDDLGSLFASFGWRKTF